MTAGSADMQLYPLGIDAQGYIIFTPEGEMAAHLWHPDRSLHPDILRDPVKMSLTYVAYAAHYRYRCAMLDHDVFVSTLPDMEGSTLRRYVDARGDEIVLSTSPLIMHDGRHEAYAAYQQLKWKSLATKAETPCEFPGSWSLLSLNTEAGAVFGIDCKGQCLVTSDGLVSILISSANRVEFAFRNPMLAAENELQSALDSSLCWLGRLQQDADAGNAKAIVWQGPHHFDCGTVRIDKVGDKLVIAWHGRVGTTSRIMSSEWLRFVGLRTDDERISSGLVKSLDVT
jgi:hypothetical protein